MSTWQELVDSARVQGSTVVFQMSLLPLQWQAGKKGIEWHTETFLSSCGEMSQTQLWQLCSAGPVALYSVYMVWRKSLRKDHGSFLFLVSAPHQEVWQLHRRANEPGLLAWLSNNRLLWLLILCMSHTDLPVLLVAFTCKAPQRPSLIASCISAWICSLVSLGAPNSPQGFPWCIQPGFTDFVSPVSRYLMCLSESHSTSLEQKQPTFLLCSGTFWVKSTFPETGNDQPSSLYNSFHASRLKPSEGPFVAITCHG